MVNTELLKTSLHTHYSISFDADWSKLSGGYECDLWRVGEWVVRLCPEWRNYEALAHIYRYVSLLAKEISEIVAPIKTAQGDNLFRFENHPVAVFPYISGQALDRNNLKLLADSADLLAQIHMVSARIVDETQRSLRSDLNPDLRPLKTDPNFIQDPQLDDWYNKFMQESDLQMGLMHGDYYRANILCAADKIVGVIDWDECTYGILIREVAWATWEHCHTEAGDNLDLPKASIFLKAYINKNREFTNFNLNAIIPLIRFHLRYEIRRSLAMEEAGAEWDNDYRQQEIRGFRNLKDLIFPSF